MIETEKDPDKKVGGKGKLTGNLVLYEEVVKYDSYEQALYAKYHIDGIVGFRKESDATSSFDFAQLVEGVSRLRTEKKSEEVQEELGPLVDAFHVKADKFGPRLRDFFRGVLSKIDSHGVGYVCEYPAVGEYVNELSLSGDLEILFSPIKTPNPSSLPEEQDKHREQIIFSWRLKSNRLKNRVIEYAKGLKSLDLLDEEGGESLEEAQLLERQKKLEELQSQPPLPHEEAGTSMPGVDPMDRLKEGESVPAIWTIKPPYGGYYKTETYTHWVEKEKQWRKDRSEFTLVREFVRSRLSAVSDSSKFDITLTALARPGKRIPIPCPHTHGINSVSFGVRKIDNALIEKDQYGDLFLTLPVEYNMSHVSVVLSPYAVTDKVFRGPKADPVSGEAILSTETEDFLASIRSLSDKQKTYKLLRYVRNRIKYIAPKDALESMMYNNSLRTDPRGFAGFVDSEKKADCDVANTYYAILASRVNLSVRHCIGHFVKGADKKAGISQINSGTGHGWSEYWDSEVSDWLRIDATSRGDSNLDQIDDVPTDNVPGDYGQHEALTASDSELEKLQKKLEERINVLSYSPEMRELSRVTNVPLAEARTIVRELEGARSLKMPQGNQTVLEVLIKAIRTVARSRTIIAVEDDGPVTQYQGGGKIQSNRFVRHIIGLKSGDSDPATREIEREEKKKEVLPNKLNVYVIGDRSSSTLDTHGDEGQALWQLQRVGTYLLGEALTSKSTGMHGSKTTEGEDLGISFEVSSFSGKKIQLDKKLSNTFGLDEKVTLWKGLSKVGGGNGDEVAMEELYKRIKSEVERERKSEKNKKDKTLRLVLACSDGGYVGSETKMRYWSTELKKLGVTVVGVGLSETAREVPTVMDFSETVDGNVEKISTGILVRDVKDLPLVFAKKVCSELIKMLPAEHRGEAERLLVNFEAEYRDK